MPKTPHILFLSEYWPPDPGGMATYVSELVPRLLKLGFRITLVVPDNGTKRHSMEYDNLTPIVFPSPKIHAFGRLSILPVLLRKINWRDIDLVVDLQVTPYAGVSSLFARHYHKPHLIGAHGNEVSRLFPGNGMTKTFTRYCLFAYRNATHIVPNSRFTAGLFKTLNIDLQKLQVIPCGVDTDFFTPVLPTEDEIAEVGGKVSGIRLIYAAGLLRLKGHDLFFRALPKIREAVPTVTVDLAGIGPLENELKQLAKELKIDDILRWHGQLPLSKLRTLYRAGDLIVLATRSDPKYNEGFGLVVAEAMACGCPAAVSNIGGQTEFVTEETGTLFEAENPDDIAEKVVSLLQQTDKLRTMREHARKQILEGYTWDHSAEKWAALLHSTLEKN